MIKIFEGDHIKISVPIDEASTLKAEDLKFLLVVDSELGVEKPCAIEEIDGVKSIVVVLEEPDTVGLNGYYIYEIRHMLDGAEKVIAQSSIIIRNSFIVDEEYTRPEERQKITELIDRIKVIEEGIANNYSNEDKERVDKILIDGDGSKYLADDGTYKTLEAIAGQDGKDGKDGEDGVDGKSAYQIALDNGFIGSEVEWIESLKGQDGADGQDGTNGINGTNGTDGKSVYQLWLDNGNSGTLQDFLASLKGEKGKDGINGQDGVDGKPGAKGEAGLPGKDGSDGINGTNGKSAYEIALDNGFVGSQAEWITSLKGQDGVNGTNGTNGVDGQDGTSVTCIQATDEADAIQKSTANPNNIYFWGE